MFRTKNSPTIIIYVHSNSADKEYEGVLKNKIMQVSKFMKKSIAAVMIAIGIASSFITVSTEELGVMGGNTGGSMYYHEETNDLYYGGKTGNIYVYDADTDRVECVIKGADKVFGVKDGCIYYTSKKDCYMYDISSSDFRKTKDFTDEIDFLYSDAVYNSQEAENLLDKSEGINADAPYAILGGDRIYVAHNKCGGYLAVYQIKNGVIDVESEQVLENTYTIWQTMMTGIGTLDWGRLVIYMLFLVIIPAVLVVWGIIILIRVRREK